MSMYSVISNYYFEKKLSGIYSIQAVEMIRKGHRLLPPPGCPRSIYELMIKCWLVVLVYVFANSIFM